MDLQEEPSLSGDSASSHASVHSVSGVFPAAYPPCRSWMLVTSCCRAAAPQTFSVWWKSAVLPACVTLPATGDKGSGARHRHQPPDILEVVDDFNVLMKEAEPGIGISRLAAPDFARLMRVARFFTAYARVKQ
eukprot:scaffold84067_cov19-Tisochrysis_lutea.AAC.1